MPHKTMDEQARAAYEAQSQQLRADLKQWEGDWAAAHGGKKPGRADIKLNPDIAQKYKQYNRLRDMIAGNISLPTDATSAQGLAQRKRTHSEAALLPPPQTPSKRTKPAPTPTADATATAAHTPAMDRTTSTPVAAEPTSISPTPQRDGRVLGLFDLLAGTPSRATADSTTRPIPSAAVTTAATPSKPRAVITISGTTGATETTPTTARFTASTPQSKRTSQLLFQTTTTTTTSPTTTTAPLHERHDQSNAAAIGFKTPSAKRTSTTTPAQLGFTPTSTTSTPSFLRRRTFPTTATATTSAALSRVDEHDAEGAAGGDGAGHGDVDDDDDVWRKIGPLRLPRKLGGLGRSLSSVVAGLRKMEEEAFGDEEDVMREMEMGGVVGGGMGMGMGMGVGAAKGGVGSGGGSRDQAHQGGKQGGEKVGGGLPSGFENEVAFDNFPDEEDGQQEQQQQEQPMRVFKKRGQKRTTRLVNMRPTRAKRPAAQPEESEEDEEEVDRVPETQFDASKPSAAPGGEDDGLRLSDADSGSDFDGSDSEDEDEVGNGAAAKTKGKHSKATAVKDDKKQTDGVVKRAVRKVKATAHANFKRLKLRNTGSKGGPGHNSRFRRRR